MVNNLLHISKELLNCLNSSNDFNEEEREYIMSVVIKTIDLCNLELEDNLDLDRKTSIRNTLLMILLLTIGIGIGIIVMYLTVLYLFKKYNINHFL